MRNFSYKALMCIAFLAFSSSSFASFSDAQTPKLKPDFGASDVGLPSVPEDRIDIYNYYKLEFLEDGYPGKKADDERVTPHPIYGAYLIYDYLRLYEETNDEVYRQAAVKVADAAMARMEYIEDHDALAFYYDESDGLTYFPNKFFSGLTQVRYLVPFYRVYKASNDPKYAQAAKQIFNSLKIPETDGGVLVNTPYGIAVEEYPHSIPTYVLNGWTSIVLELLKYEDLAEDNEAGLFARSNIKTIERLLASYDHPATFLSRYQLTGFIYIKFIFNLPRSCKPLEFETIFGEKSYGLGKEGNRWSNYVLSKDIEEDGYPTHRQFLVNGVFSQINSEHAFMVNLECRQSGATVDIYLANGDYDPKVSAMPTKRWIWLDQKSLEVGENKFTIAADKDNFDMIGYPTNFAKEIAGEARNVYHWLHITNFEKILGYLNSREIAYYTAKWTEYTKAWKSLPVLQRDDLSYDIPPGSIKSRQVIKEFHEYR